MNETNCVVTPKCSHKLRWRPNDDFRAYGIFDSALDLFFSLCIENELGWMDGKNVKIYILYIAANANKTEQGNDK